MLLSRMFSPAKNTKNVSFANVNVPEDIALYQ
jgi:hypothetical protein